MWFNTKKKNIIEFILIAKKIKDLFPHKNINYYGVNENDNYTNLIHKFNKDNGSPVNFLFCLHDEMPLEYKKHQWIIYPIDKELLTVGYPLAIVEAQASGVGVIMYNARNDLIDFVSENGYLYTQIDEVIYIIKNYFYNKKILN
jgi:glycosyltransferase involved in cell wall biosynthesis